jgi:hypothetical protein
VGFVEMQAGCTLRGEAPPAGHKDWYDDSTWSPTTANVLLVGVRGARRVISDCHFRKTATEYDRKTGIKWSSSTEN